MNICRQLMLLGLTTIYSSIMVGMGQQKVALKFTDMPKAIEAFIKDNNIEQLELLGTWLNAQRKHISDETEWKGLINVLTSFIPMSRYRSLENAQKSAFKKLLNNQIANAQPSDNCKAILLSHAAVELECARQKYAELTAQRDTDWEF